jgi:hypothetical protein
MPLRSSARPFSSARSYSFAILLKSLRPISFASRLIANPRSALALLCAVTLYFAIPLLNNAPLLFATPLLYQALLTALCFAIPSLYLASPYAALPPLRIA